MADDDYVDGQLSTDVPPRTRPLDQRGKPIREVIKPETLFAPRPLEGNLDGERELADGNEESNRQETSEESRPDGQRHRTDPAKRHDADADDGYDLLDEEPEHLTPERESETTDGEIEQDDEGPSYEIMIDGEPREVSLKEALAGYIREETFHKRMSELDVIQSNMEAEATQQQTFAAHLSKAEKDYQENLIDMIPPPVDWDHEFRTNPNARDKQKSYEILYGVLNASRQRQLETDMRAQQEVDRHVEQYIINGQRKFYLENKKHFPDKATYDKNIRSMQRTAADAEFKREEYSKIFDHRMLKVLFWASMYRRMQASQAKPVVPGKGRTLKPGAATPLNGNVTRRGLDEAQKRLQSTGRLDDAADVIGRILQRG